jgi:rubrerythrin
MESKTVADVIDTAIKREEDAHAFYLDLAKRVAEEDAKDSILWIAGEEKKHKEFLVNYRKGGYGVEALRMSDVVDYKIAEYQEEPEVKDDLSSAQVFLVAAHREVRSHKFYSEMAALHPEGTTRSILQKMANEELKHKEKMEYLYANTAFPQTSGG